MVTSIAGFAICSLLVIVSGTRLSYHGNRIAELTGMSKAWVGLIMMASITSLPELITGISSVAIIKAPDLAAGDVFGSCVFNLLILSVLDTRIRKPLTSLVKRSHVVAGFFSLILMAVAGLAILTADKFPVMLWVSGFTPVILLVYMMAMWGIFKFDKSGTMPPVLERTPPYAYKPTTLRLSVITYGFNALIVVVSALFLPYFGEQIAFHYGLSNTFFGTLFLAATTSMPELVVSFASIRLHAYDMLVGNLFGSNIFNMLILGIDDLFYTEGSLYAAISPAHLVSVTVTIVMTAVAGLGIMMRPQRKIWLFSLDTFIIFLIYVLLMIYLFFYNR